MTDHNRNKQGGLERPVTFLVIDSSAQLDTRLRQPFQNTVLDEI